MDHATRSCFGVTEGVCNCRHFLFVLGIETLLTCHGSHMGRVKSRSLAASSPIFLTITQDQLSFSIQSQQYVHATLCVLILRSESWYFVSKIRPPRRSPSASSACSASQPPSNLVNRQDSPDPLQVFPSLQLISQWRTSPPNTP
jgi:hypothetical protein